MTRLNLRRRKMAENFVNEQMPRCPLCKTKEPDWTFEHTEFLQDKKVIYTCSSCHCRLSSNYGEMKGVFGESFSEFIQGAASYDAMVRSVYGKKKGVIYVNIVDTGENEKIEEYQGQEIPYMELKEMFW